jgi:hypothetical protein
MEFNILGPVAAASTFLGVWFGHVAVRKIESISQTIWLPTLFFAIAGIALEGVSLFTFNVPLSTASGILGFTFLWDALEFTRQQNRIKKGHAPANPANPRHARLLQQYPAATTLDLLKRHPVGRPVTNAEAASLITQPE